MKALEVLTASEGTKFPLADELFRRAYREFELHDYGHIIPYTQWAAVLELDPQHDSRARRAILRASRVLLREYRKKVVCIRDIGYRIVAPNEQPAVSVSERRRAKRLLKKSLETSMYIHLDKLTPIEVALAMTEQARAAMIYALASRVERPKQLPPRSEMHIPSSTKLIELLRRKPAG